MANQDPLSHDERVLRALRLLIRGVRAWPVEASSVAERDDQEPPSVELKAEWDARARGRLPRT
jgi:hypothetical protein